MRRLVVRTAAGGKLSTRQPRNGGRSEGYAAPAPMPRASLGRSVCCCWHYASALGQAAQRTGQNVRAPRRRPSGRVARGRGRPDAPQCRSWAAQSPRTATGLAERVPPSKGTWERRVSEGYEWALWGVKTRGAVAPTVWLRPETAPLVALLHSDVPYCINQRRVCISHLYSADLPTKTVCFSLIPDLSTRRRPRGMRWHRVSSFAVGAASAPTCPLLSGS